MSKAYNQGDKVKWKWGDNWAHGKVAKRYTQKITLKIDGNEVTRDASEDEPAYKVEQSDGGEALKSHSELNKE